MLGLDFGGKYAPEEGLTPFYQGVFPFRRVETKEIDISLSNESSQTLHAPSIPQYLRSSHKLHRSH